MNENNFDLNQPKNIKEKIKQIGSVVILGAIGSGIWSGVGSPIWSWFSALFVRTISLVSVSYIDYIYSSVGEGLNDNPSLLTHLLISGMIVGFWIVLGFIAPFMLNSRFKKINQSETDKTNNTKFNKTAQLKKAGNIDQYYIWTLPFIGMAIILSICSTSIKESNNHETVIYIERSLDIISPYLSEQDRLMLRSEYRSIDSAKKFYKMHDKFIAVSKEKNIPLPTFKPL